MKLRLVESGCGLTGGLRMTSIYHQRVHFPFSLPATSQRVLEVSNHWWYSMLIQPPLLKDSVAAPLLSAYYPDCVGMSPSCTSTNRAAATTTSSASPGKMEPSKAAPFPLGERCSGFPFLTSPSPPWKFKGKQTAEDSNVTCYKSLTVACVWLCITD